MVTDWMLKDEAEAANLTIVNDVFVLKNHCFSMVSLIQSPTAMKYTVLLFLLAAFIAKSSAQSLNKMAGLRQRLKGWSMYNRDSTGDFILSDSLRFSYSGLRHPEFDNNNLDFDIEAIQQLETFLTHKPS